MKVVRFPEWQEALHGSGLGESEKEAFAITIRWYLKDCLTKDWEISIQSARDFVTHARREHPRIPDYAVAQWKSALNWFFCEAKQSMIVTACPKGEGSDP